MSLYKEMMRPLYSLISIIVIEVLSYPGVWLRDTIGYLAILIPCIDVFVMTLLYISKKRVSDGILMFLSIFGALWIPINTLMYNIRFRRILYRDNILTILLTVRIIHCMIMIYMSSRVLYSRINANHKVLSKGYVIEQDGRICILDRDYICFQYNDVQDISLPDTYRELPVIVCNNSFDDIAVMIRTFQHEDENLHTHILHPFLIWVRNSTTTTLYKGSKVPFLDSKGVGLYNSYIILENNVDAIDIVPSIERYTHKMKQRYGTIDLVYQYLRRTVSSLSMDKLEGYGIYALLINGTLKMRSQSIHVYYGYYVPLLSHYVLTTERTERSQLIRVVDTSLPNVLSGTHKVYTSVTIFNNIPNSYTDISII